MMQVFVFSPNESLRNLVSLLSLEQIKATRGFAVYLYGIGIWDETVRSCELSASAAPAQCSPAEPQKPAHQPPSACEVRPAPRSADRRPPPEAPRRSAVSALPAVRAAASARVRAVVWSPARLRLDRLGGTEQSDQDSEEGLGQTELGRPWGVFARGAVVWAFRNWVVWPITRRVSMVFLFFSKLVPGPPRGDAALRSTEKRWRGSSRTEPRP